MSTSNFSPRRAIVTGSNSGIGRATALALAEAGMDVGITFHSDSDGAEETADMVRSLGRDAHIAQLDTGELDSVFGTITSLIEKLGGLDVFVNNAGVMDVAPFLEMDLETWRHTIAADLDGSFIAIQTAAKTMVEQGAGGRIIGVTSVHEHQPRVGSSAYDAAKHGFGGLLKTAALELGQHDITVNAVAPGEIATPMNDMTDEDAFNTHRPGIPLGRSGIAGEIASVIAFLASPASSYVTGASWAVDGGMLQMGPQGGSHLTTDDWRGAATE